MKMKYHITKEYLVDKPVNLVFDELDLIITQPYFWMRKSSFMNSNAMDLTGHFVGGEPPAFTICFRRSKSTGWHLSVVLYKQDNKTKIVMQSKSNSTLYVMAFIVLVGFIISLFTNKLADAVKAGAIYVGAMAVLLVIDVLAQRLLVEEFERRMKLS